MIRKEFWRKKCFFCQFSKYFQAAYTFDAGANACVYLLESEVDKFLSYLNVYFPNDENAGNEYFRGIPVQLNALNGAVRENILFNVFNTLIQLDCISSQDLESIGSTTPVTKGAFKYIIHTKVGEGPQRLDDSESLLDSNGLPKKLQ